MYQDVRIEIAAAAASHPPRPGPNGFLATLYDGSTVLLRPVIPADKWRIEEGLTHMSPRSLYQRFFRQVGRLSEDELGFLTRVDQVQHIAWGAVDPEDPAERGLGIARLICEPDCPARAEAALAVIDSHHGVGLGTVLLATLCAMGQIRGIQTLRACVLPGNHLVVSWFKRLGARPVDEDDQDLVVLDLDLGDSFAEQTCGRRFGALVQRMRTILVEQSA